MSGSRFGMGFMQGLQGGFGIARTIARDEESDRRYQESVQYRDERDQIADQRYEEQSGLRKMIGDRQMRNLDQQYNQNDYNFGRAKKEDNRTDQLTEVQGYIRLLENGDDAGMVAQSLNSNPHYQKFLANRGLGNAKFHSLRLNDTGKGQPGVVTLLEGEDKKTGERRRGVMTVNASSDPNDPVEIMPVPVLVDLVERKADEVEANGDPESANQLRTSLLKRLKMYEASLGGGRKPKWGGVEYRPGLGYLQKDPEGKIYQLDGDKDPHSKGPGSGFGSGDDKQRNARLSLLYRQLSGVFEDDEMAGKDYGVVRDLSVSLAQDYDLMTRGALAPGIYGQVAKESASGLALSVADATQMAVDELNEGTVFSSYDPNDEEVQQRAENILAEHKQEFARRFRGNIDSMLQARFGRGVGGGQQPTDRPQNTQPQSLDDAVKLMVKRAKSQGSNISDDEAREYLIGRYPDRFGEVVEAQPEVGGSSGLMGAIEKNAEGINRDIVQPVARGVKAITGGLNDSLKASKARQDYRVALETGKPTAYGLASWIPYLEGEEKQQAIDKMMELYPDHELTKKVISEYNQVATR